MQHSDYYALARADLLAYVSLVSPWYRPGAWHHYLCDELRGFIEACERGESPRLVIMAPPRHGKTELVSKHLPAWVLGKLPHWEIILATYAQQLASENGRKVRNLMSDPVHCQIFPGVALADDSSAKDHFIVRSGDGLKEGAATFTGLDGSITGRGANVLIIDDPIKGREQADSPVMRRQLHAWYDDVAQTRIMDGGGILVMATRWHEADLIGYVLDQYKAEGWRVISLPALCEQPGDALGREIGDALWPQKVPASRLESIRLNSPVRTWASLYQQRPQPDKGAYFEVDKIKRYDIAPANLVIIGATDAATSVEAGDYTEHGIIGVDHNMRWHVLDWWSGRTSSDVWASAQIDLIQKWRPAIWFDEAGVIHKAVDPFRRKLMQERGVGLRMETLPSLIGKTGRADGLRGMVSMGWLHLPAGREWAQRIIDQMTSFPSGSYNDCVDVLSLAVRGQTQFGKAINPVMPRSVPAILPAGIVRVEDLEYEEAPPRSRYKA
jgi:predicted phage terminase large subunit-like protein